MHKAKPVSSPLTGHFKLRSQQCPTSENEREQMSKIPYASTDHNLMYAMVYTKPNLAHSAGSSLMDSQISLRYNQDVLMFRNGKACVTWVHRCRHGK